MTYAILSTFYKFISKIRNPNWETRFIHLTERNYVYTGSAKINIGKRIAIHLSKDKNLHWHIDYLFANEQTKIIKVTTSELRECDLNTDVKGKIIVEGFGNSDCKENCKSHLKFLS